MNYFNNIKKDFVAIFDKNKDGKIQFHELYPLTLLFAMLLLLYIILRNLNILIIFKQTRLFIVFFALLLLYSVLDIINYNRTFDSNHKPSIEDNFYYVINVMNILICALVLIYLSVVLGVFFK